MVKKKYVLSKNKSIFCALTGAGVGFLLSYLFLKNHYSSNFEGVEGYAWSLYLVCFTWIGAMVGAIGYLLVSSWLFRKKVI